MKDKGIKELLEIYRKAATEIFLAFGFDEAYGEIESKIDVEWTLDGEESVTWIENGDVYSNEIRRGGPMYHENWMMVYVDNGCGENYYQIFDSNRRNDDIENY